MATTTLHSKPGTNVVQHYANDGGSSFHFTSYAFASLEHSYNNTEACVDEIDAGAVATKNAPRKSALVNNQINLHFFFAALGGNLELAKSIAAEPKAA